MILLMNKFTSIAMDDWTLDVYANYYENKEWQIMLGSNLVLVTLQGWCTISIEHDKYNWWH